MDKATRVISGTWGEMWLEGEKVAECYKLQAKRTFNKEKVPMCGQMEVDTKILNIEGTGSVGLYKAVSYTHLQFEHRCSHDGGGAAGVRRHIRAG